MLALIAFCLLSQEISSSDVRAIVAKADGETLKEKALNGVHEVCKQVCQQIQDSKLVTASNKKKVEDSFNEVADLIQICKKKKNADSYSDVIGKMSFYFRIIVRNVPNQTYSGMKAEALRNACYQALDSARK